VSESLTGPEPGRGRLVAGRYRLAEQIGRGGMGTVWRAEDELLGRLVAVKQLHVSPYLEEDEVATLYERTRREARSAARITHPNVVVVHDVVEDRGLPCIVMEYVPSTTLSDVLKRYGTISPDETARIGRGMVAALRAAHAAGVLHRDVKPGNVLLGEDGRVVLTDFGIAQSSGMSTLTKTGEMVGSIDYIAPERVKGASPGPASDLWALGATLYQALEGRPPFRKDTPVETAYAIAVDPLVPPRNAGVLTRLIEGLLAKDPEIRPPAELVEQILREPMAEAQTAFMQTIDVTAERPQPAQPFPAADDASERLTGPVPVLEPAATTTAATAPTAPTAPMDPAAPTAPAVEVPAADEPQAQPKGGSHKVRTTLLITVVLAAVAGGTYYFVGPFGPSAPSAADSADKGTPAATGGDASPSASQSLPPQPTPPPGYHQVTEKSLGVSFPVPDGWQRLVKSGQEIDYIGGPNQLVDIKINVLDFASPDHLQHWKDVEKQLKTEVPGYKLGRMQGTTYLGQPAAVWEFSWDGRLRRYQAIDLGFGKEGSSEYAIYLSAPEADWEKYRPIFDVVCNGFRPTK